MNKFQRFKEIILLKRASVIVIVGSFLYGMQLFRHPEILDQYRVYEMIRELFDGRQIGLVFVILSMIKAYGIVTNSKLAKTISRTALMFLWCLFLVAFLISPPPNTVWVLAFIMVSLIGMTTINPRG